MNRYVSIAIHLLYSTYFKTPVQYRRYTTGSYDVSLTFTGLASYYHHRQHYDMQYRQ
jgi:hypothetical protein